MKLTNHTTAAAAILKNGSPTSDRHMMGCVIARRTYAVKADGALEETPDQKWPVGVVQADTPLGRMPGDKPFYMGGVDILLGGKIHAKDLTDRLEVELEVGRTFRRRIIVTGDRTWAAAPDGTPVMTPPRTFRTMPLSYSLAFGGKAQSSVGLSPYSANPEGTGYALDAGDAIGKRLPNLEHPAHLLSQWDDRPMPPGLGYYPEDGALRPLAAIDHPMIEPARSSLFGRGPVKAPPAAGEGGAVTVNHLLPTFFNQAHPDMVLEAGKTPKPGERVRLSNGRINGEDLAFSMPAEALHLYVQIHDRAHLLPMHLDQIGLIAGEARVLLSYRVIFEYGMTRGEKRFAALYPGPVPPAVPDAYRQPFTDEWDEDWWEREDASAITG